MIVKELFDSQKFVLSFEVFPPKTDKGEENLNSTLKELANWKPGFISCTYGAGGGTQDKTLQIVDRIQSDYNTTATAHFTCVGSNIEQIRSWLDRAKSLNVQNIMALRGDPPHGEDSFQAVEGGFQYAVELVEFIAKEYPNFGIGVAGYPETHQEAPSPQFDLENLKRKVDAGGQAVFTQLFYHNEDFFRFRDDCEKLNIEVPIVPGIMPILNYNQINRITSLCKARLPDQLRSDLENAGEDKEEQKKIGIDYCVNQCRELFDHNVRGIHFYVLNQSDVTNQIMQQLQSDIPQ